MLEIFTNWVATESAAKGVSEMIFLSSQAASTLLLIIAVVSMQFKNMKPILISQCITNGLAALSMALMGGLSGATTCFVAIAHTLYIYMYRSKDKEPPLASTIIALVIYIACAVASYTKPIDLLIIPASITFILSIIQKRPSVYRIIIFANSLLYAIYNLALGVYPSVLTYIIMMVSNIIAMIRHDREDWKNIFNRK